VARQIKLDILCESVAHCQPRFSGSCSAVRAFWVVSHNPRVEASKNNGDEIHHTAQYKNGTSSQAFFAFPSLPYRALPCDRCLVITMFSSLFTPFHSGNTGSNPVGDAMTLKDLLRSPLRERFGRTRYERDNPTADTQFLARRIPSLPLLGPVIARGFRLPIEPGWGTAKANRMATTPR